MYLVQTKEVTVDRFLNFLNEGAVDKSYRERHFKEPEVGREALLPKTRQVASVRMEMERLLGEPKKRSSWESSSKWTKPVLPKEFTQG